MNLSDHSTTLIVGTNGAGKSTMLDALSFAMFGKAFRKIKLGQLVNTINKKHCVVELEFKVNNTQYKVVRGIKPAVFDIFVDGELKDQDAKTKDYQLNLEQHILKMNESSFRQIVVLGSGSFVPFMRLPAPQRRSIIEELLGIQIFSVMNDINKDRLSNLKDDIKDNSYDVKLTEEKIGMQKKNLENLRNKDENRITEINVDIVGNQKSIETITETIDRYRSDIDKMAGSITDESTVNDRRSKLSKFRAKFTSSKNSLQKEILFFNTNQHCPTCSQGILEEHKDTMLMTREDKMTELETAMSTLGKELTKIEERVDSIETVRYDIGDIESKISKNNNSISAINKYITKLHNEINIILASDVELMDDSELNRLNVLLDKLSNNKYELLEIQQHHLIVASMLKDTGIKTRIIRNYLPAMNKLINKYLSAMNFSVSFSLDENFTEIIKSRYRDEFSYASFSEGEKLRIDLALLFTWREVAKLRNSTNCNLLILDEVFDSSLDQTGIDDFLAILRTLGKETNTFVISHKGAEIESKFDKLLRVKKQKNFSTIL
jgi:DNA repair exonuclease SbcCD ATPase subunit